MNFEPNLNDLNKDAPSEIQKKRREFFVIFLISFFFIILTWFEIRLFDIAQQLPFVHSVFFFGLVNFNIVLLLFLLFMIFRNLVKIFVERQNKIFGSSLKAKLTVAFLIFTIVPTFLIFITNVTYVNASFDKWFNNKVQSVLKSSIEISQSFHFNAKKRNYHFAFLIANDLEKNFSPQKRLKKIRELRKLYGLDAVEYYSGVKGTREIVLSEEESIPMIPYLEDEVLSRAFEIQNQVSTIQTFSSGNLVRVIVPLQKNKGAIVVTSYIPLSLISKMNDISKVFEEFRDTNPLQYPLKSIYLTILILITLVIIMAAIWFGIYLAKQLSTPLVRLGLATQKIAEGHFEILDVKSGSEEINNLVLSFNQMSQILATSEIQLKLANESLMATLKELDQHSRYNEEVLRSISAGVVSVDRKGKLTTINRRAGDLLKINPEDWHGKSVRELLSLDHFRTFVQLVRMMNEHKVGYIQKELRVHVEGESKPLLLHLSILRTEGGDEIGKLAVFDDLSPIIQAQRAAAWREVARRIAHEIKNPLTPIKLSAERLLRKFGNQIKDPAFHESTKMIIQQTDELKLMVNEFAQFARLPEIQIKPSLIDEVLSESITLFKESYRNITFIVQFDDSIPKFSFDPDQIKRVITNLLDNAISAFNEEISHKEIILKTELVKEISFVRISVIDTGIGISQENKLQIFEPYYTTKKDGTGLGLAIVKRIVEDHNGYIRVLDYIPQGTHIMIELPLA